MLRNISFVYPGTQVTDTLEAILQEHNKEQQKKDISLFVASTNDPSATTGLPIKLGPGLLQIRNEIMPVRAGMLYFQGPNKFWVASRPKRYIAAANDLVIGVVTHKLAELYRVDLGTHMNATLPLSGFEGATKKNKPNLAIGSVVFARVSVANKDLETELVCFDTENKPEGFGELKEEAYLAQIPCSYAVSLQKPDSPILNALGKHFAFEIAVGANGRFVLRAGSPAETIHLANAIVNAEHMDRNELNNLVKELLGQFKPSNAATT